MLQHYLGLRRWTTLLFFLLSLAHTEASEIPEWQLTYTQGRTRLFLRLPSPSLHSTADYLHGQIPVLATASYLASAGLPDLPILSYEIVLESENGATLIATHTVDTTLQAITIAPAREPRIVGRPLGARIAGSTYLESVFTPSEQVTLSAPYYADGKWRQTVYVSPYQYNPVQHELRSAKSITIELKGVEHSTALPKRKTRSLFTSDENGALLIVTPTRYLATLQPFIEWKRERGLTVETLIYGGIMEGYPNVSDTTALQQYLRNRYNQSGTPLKFVLLVGNRNEVPPLRRDAPAGVKADSDQAYGQIIGNDPYNEIYIGRFSAYTIEHVKTQVERVLWYERDLRHHENGYNRGLCIASNEGWINGDRNETDLEHSKNIRNVLLQRGYTSVELLFDADNHPLTPTPVANEINRGVGVITYVGHGYPRSWKTSRFSSSDVESLTPNSTYPVIFNTACDNGNMESGKCFAEAWLWAQQSGRPTGAIGINASSEAQYWDAPMRGQDAMIEYFTKQRELPYVVTLGGIMTAGMKDMLIAYGSTPKSTGRITAETWNIFGDPSVVLRTKAPEVLNVTHPSDLLVSDRNWEVHCPSEEIQATLKITYPSGEVRYDNADFIGGRARFTGLDLVKDAIAHLTVWGVNKETYTADLPCIESDSSPLRIKSYRLKPKTLNTTGLVNAGETWEVWGTFAYQGKTGALEGVQAHLNVLPDKDATIIPTTGIVLPTFNTFQQEEEVKLGELRIGDDVANGTTLSVTLSLRSGAALLSKRTMSVRVYAAHAQIDSLQVSSALAVQAGVNLPLRLYISNRGLSDFTFGELRFYWEGSSSTLTQGVAHIRTGERATVFQSIVVPSPLAPHEVATLHVELWKGKHKHSSQTLKVVGDLPLTPLLRYANNYPFGTTDAAYQETYFYFDKPRFIEKGGRLLSVQLPIYYAEAALPLEQFYIDILHRDEISLSEKVIERIDPSKAFQGEYPIHNGIITLPIEPYDYNTFDRDLVLRIRCKGDARIGEYIIPQNKESYRRTLGRTEYRDGRLDTVTSNSLPLLRFETAIETLFTFTLLDELGQPCKEAEVSVNGERYKSDENGNVNASLWEGNYSVKVFSATLGLQIFEVALRKTMTRHTLQMKEAPLLDITCVVRTPSGERIANGLIRVEGHEYFTNTEGIVTLQVRGGSRQFQIYADGYEGKTFTERITNTTTPYEFILTPRTSVPTFEVQGSPNPTQGELYLSANSLMHHIRLYAINGSMIASYRLHGYRYALDLAHLPRGFYIIEIEGNSRRQLVRLRIVKGL